MSYAYESRVLGTGVLSPTGHYLNIASSNWAPGKGGIEEANGLRTYLNLAYYGIKNAAASVGLGEKGMGYSFVAIVPDGEMLAGILAQLEMGAVRAVIDKQFDLAEAKQAYEHLETGRAKGKVVIKI
jgi:NADPH:quinone reductase-like Zn-dependent oxidoreductase